MIKDIKTQKRISYLLLTCAIFLASVVGFFSVKGLSQVFAGAGMAIILLGAGIEVSKLVIASFLHRYWDKLTFGYKVGGLIFLFLVIFVTSSGVYGILSQAYTENKNKLMASKSEVALIEEKKKFFIDKKNDLQSEYKQIISDITQTRLQRNTTSSGMMSDSKDVYTDSRGRTSSRSNASTRKDYLQQVEGLNSDIGKMESRRDGVYVDITNISDSIFYYETKIIAIKSSNDVAVELGPLIYLSEVTNTSLDKVLFWFLMVIVFLADPLAIALLTAYHYTQKVIIEENEKDSDNIEKNPIPETPKERSPLAEFYSDDLTEEDTRYIQDFNEKVKFTSSFAEFTSSFAEFTSSFGEPLVGSRVPTNSNNLQGDFSLSMALSKPKRRGRPTGSKNKPKNNSIESTNEFADMTIVKGSFNEVKEDSDAAIAEQVILQEIVTGSFDSFVQEEIEPEVIEEVESEVIEEVESDVIEDITFEPIDEDYDISSGEQEEEIIIPASKNQVKSRNYREPKTDVKKNSLNRN
jgi:hypothetical protein